MNVQITRWEWVKAWALERWVGVLVAWYRWRNARIRSRHKCVWRCLRDGGGGSQRTPRPMTEAQAVVWVSRVLHAEVFYVDFENRFIFYRSLK